MSQSAKTKGMWKDCPQCGESDPNNFYYYKNKKVKTSNLCKVCHCQRSRERWYKRSELDQNISTVKRLYNLDKDKYIKLINEHKGLCAICNKEPDTKRGLHVDHDHSTGEVRGLLCHRCNTGLGQFLDDPELLNSAISYLKESTHGRT